MLSQAECHELWEYEDGKLYWKVTLNSRAVVGAEAGYISKNICYASTVRYEGRNYNMGKVIFMMFHGYCPERIHFINKDKQDFRIENLRAITISQHITKNKKGRNSTSNYKGVTYNKWAKKWKAHIVKDYKKYLLGYFEEKEEAYKVYCEAAKKLHGEFANFG